MKLFIPCIIPSLSAPLQGEACPTFLFIDCILAIFESERGDGCLQGALLRLPGAAVHQLGSKRPDARLLITMFVRCRGKFRLPF